MRPNSRLFLMTLVLSAVVAVLAAACAPSPAPPSAGTAAAPAVGPDATPAPSQPAQPSEPPPQPSQPPPDGLKTLRLDGATASPAWRLTLPSRYYVYEQDTDRVAYLEAEPGKPAVLHVINREGHEQFRQVFPRLANQLDQHVLVRVSLAPDGRVAVFDADWFLTILDPAGQQVARIETQRESWPRWSAGGRQLVLHDAHLVPVASLYAGDGAYVNELIPPRAASRPDELTIAVEPSSGWIAWSDRQEVHLLRDGREVWQAPLTGKADRLGVTDSGQVWMARRRTVTEPARVSLVGPDKQWTYSLPADASVMTPALAAQTGWTWVVYAVRLPGQAVRYHLLLLDDEGHRAEEWETPEINSLRTVRNGTFVLLETCAPAGPCGSLVAVDPNGGVVWRYAATSLERYMLSADGSIIYVVDSGELLAFRLAAGG